MSKDMPSVTAIVLGWNHRDDSAECIASILNSGYPSVRVTYVDNGSSDDAPAYLSRAFSQIEMVALEENKGLVPGYNAGIQHALGTDAEYICVFNNDVSVEPGAFDSLIATAQTLERAGLLVPKIVLYSDRDIIWSAGARERRFPPGIVQRGTGASTQDKRFSTTEPIDFATSCSWMMTAEMIRQVGLFDPAYPFYYSDYDYCERVKQMEWQIIYEPTAVVQHKVSLSTQRGPEVGRWWENLGDAEMRFYRQHKSLLRLGAHMPWILIRTMLQGRTRYIPAYLRGLWNARNV